MPFTPLRANPMQRPNTEAMSEKAVVYLRVSSAEQVENFSLETQRRILD